MTDTGGHGAKLSARDVTIHYWLERSNSAFLAVDGVNLDVHEGEPGCNTSPATGGSISVAIARLIPIRVSAYQMASGSLIFISRKIHWRDISCQRSAESDRRAARWDRKSAYS